MKESKVFLTVVACFALLSSCVVSSQHIVTGNPVGSKVGYIKTKAKKNFDGVAGTAKKGGIKKIATVDIKYYAAGKISIKVTGE